MSLASDKRQLKTEINRYMTLVSNLQNPSIDFLNHLENLKGLVDASNAEEVEELQQTWQAIRPTDERSVKYLETGKLDDQ